MLKLLIADDEKAIRETICSFIDWKSLDIDVIGTARDGIEAYNMFSINIQILFSPTFGCLVCQVLI